MYISKNDLKKISSLNRKSKRKEHGLFIVEGEKNCKELIKSNFEVKVILVSSNPTTFSTPSDTFIFFDRITLLKLS